MERLPARYFDGKSSASHPVTLCIADDGLVRLEPDLIRSAFHLRDIRIDGRLPRAPAVLRFPDGGCIETEAHALLDECLSRHGRGRGMLHRLESCWPVLLAAGPLLVLIATLFYLFVTPLLARAVASVVPESVVQRIDHHTLEQMDGWAFAPSQLPEQRQEALLARFEEIVGSLGIGSKARLVFRSGGWLDANAFALPGGTVVLTDELVWIAASDEQITGVLLHELGHVRLGHSLQRVVHRLGLGVATLFVFGNTGDIAGAVVSIPVMLAETAYSREMERAADDFAVRQMRSLGIPPAELAGLYQRLALYAGHCRAAARAGPAVAPTSGEADEGARGSPPPFDAEAVGACLEAQRGPGNDTAFSDEGWAGYFSTHPGMAERVEHILSE